MRNTETWQCWTGGGQWQPPPKHPDDDDDDDKKKEDDDGDDDDDEERRADASGLVLGRFDPPHRGHQYLFDVADGWVAHLTITVVGGPNDAVPLAQRVSWVRSMAPRAQVHGVHGDDRGAQLAGIRQLIDAPVTYLFSSERELEVPITGVAERHIPVDPDRLAVPISSTMIRYDPLEHWAQLPKVVRPYAVRRVRIVGAESTGKTTLASELARRFRTRWVPEFARIAAEARGGDLSGRDLHDVARGQINSEDAAALQSTRLLFCDTDLLTASLWTERLGAPAQSWWATEIDRRPYDLTLFCAADVPFVGAPSRDEPVARRGFSDDLARALEVAGVEPVVLEGDWRSRLTAAREAVDGLLRGGGLAAARAPFLNG